jgi:hypothetical protein
MRKILLTFVCIMSFQAFAAPDAVSEFVNQALVEGRAILEIKDTTDRNLQMCDLLHKTLGSNQISSLWLGKYETLARDQAGIDEFKGMVPSILMTKAVPILGTGGKGGTFVVDEQSKERSAFIYEVGINVTNGGKVYRALAIVQFNDKGDYELIDVEYNNYSAVGYQGREFMRFLDREYNRDPNNSLPVTALVRHIKAQDDYIGCP